MQFQACVDQYSQVSRVFCEGEEARRPTNSWESQCIKELSDYVIVNLNRVAFDRKAAKQYKIHTKVVFPQTPVDMGANIDDAYEAMAVLEHTGQNTERGHWTCTKKMNGKWWFCNDAEVSELSTEQLQRHQSASMIILKRISR